MNRITEINLEGNFGERWARVREDFWGDLKTENLRALQNLLQGSLQIEMQDLLGCPPWQYQKTRLNYRNGYYRRTLQTSYGFISKLHVPRLREGKIQFKSLKHYAQRSQELDQLIQEMFLAGVSRRRVQEMLQPILSSGSISASTVNRITQGLQKQVDRYTPPCSNSRKSLILFCCHPCFRDCARSWFLLFLNLDFMVLRFEFFLRALL